MLLDRDDPDFIGAVLHELRTEVGRNKLSASRASVREHAGAPIKLFQPIQRRFHIALIEAWCDTAGNPRIDPARVEKAGMVLRRVRQDRHQHRIRLEGWMKAGGSLRGWLPVESLGAIDADPLPQVRQTQRAIGIAAIDRAMHGLRAEPEGGWLEEQVTPMFVAPPEVCKASGRTVFYGVVATSSSDLAQSEPDSEEPFEGFEPHTDAFQNHLMQPLRGEASTLPAPPLASRRFDSNWFDALSKSAPGTDSYRFLRLLQQLVTEFDLFGDSAASKDLRQHLSLIDLPYVQDPIRPWAPRRTVKAEAFLRQCHEVLILEQDGTVEMPERWPAIENADDRRALASALSNAMKQRFKTVKGRPGRFDEPDARYVVQAFVRLKAHGDCPARTVWTEQPSEPFVIAPWYESQGDPVQIPLPSHGLLKKLKPGVSFVVPKDLQHLLGGDAKKLLEGDASLGSGSGSESSIAWICSFSIPVITFCAFFVLNIFLSLFDFIFRWKMFIKICIPFPKFK